MNEKRRLNRVRWTQNPGTADGEALAQNPAPWAMSPADSPFFASLSDEDEAAFVQENSVPETGGAWAMANASSDEEAFDGYPPEEEISPEEAALLAQFSQLEEGHSLRNALLILIVLYIICGLAPLFIALFVSLRVFFWTEIGGWLIILAWLLIGVRPPFTVWLKERLRERKEQLKEQI